MKFGKAYAIFGNINSDKYTDQEKLEAIKQICRMETHNSVKKDEMIEALRWMCAQMAWTPVSEGLPEKEGNYLCTIKGPDDRCIVFFNDYGNVIAPGADRKKILPNGYAFGVTWSDGLDSLDDVIAWKPKPLPYTESEAEE